MCALSTCAPYQLNGFTRAFLAQTLTHFISLKSYPNLVFRKFHWLCVCVFVCEPCCGVPMWLSSVIWLRCTCISPMCNFRVFICNFPCAARFVLCIFFCFFSSLLFPRNWNAFHRAVSAPGNWFSMPFFSVVVVCNSSTHRVLCTPWFYIQCKHIFVRVHSLHICWHANVQAFIARI